jgi:hypothetical protein
LSFVSQRPISTSLAFGHIGEDFYTSSSGEDRKGATSRKKCWSTSPELAKSIGSSYAKDAVETVKIAGEKNEFRLRTQSRKAKDQ